MLKSLALFFAETVEVVAGFSALVFELDAFETLVKLLIAFIAVLLADWIAVAWSPLKVLP